MDKSTRVICVYNQKGGVGKSTTAVNISQIMAEVKNKKMIPIVNHFDASYDNFQLLPFSSYSEELAAEHGQRTVSADFTYAWLREQLKQLYDGEITWQ